MNLGTNLSQLVCLEASCFTNIQFKSISNNKENDIDLEDFLECCI